RYPVVFHCIAPEPASLVLSTPNDSIPAGGASTLIIATVLDENGNPYDAGSPFWDGLYIAFDIMDSSGGASFDSLNQMRYDTVLTNINSQAIVQLFSGHRAGITVSIRACTVAYPPDSLYLCDQKPLVTITPGEPENITFAFSAVAQVEPGSQERYCQVGTIIGDRYSNPVDNGIPVHFSLFPPDLAYIDSISYTGHGNPHHPDSAHGVAYACIYYGCLSTFLPIQVVAAVGDPVTITDTSSNYSLPIYQGEIDLLPNPGNLFTADSSCDSRDTTWVTATLTDGGGCRINGGIIVFAAPVVGTRIGQAIDTTDMDGHAHTMFMIRGCDIPCSDSECTITATAKATLVQKPSVWSVVEIPCSRPLIRMR
ncbi:MAG TPA: hypothetical protein DEO84_07645, partial [candidate division Zixibacteria bacterium]|nr:hypothetical protein [candidate division Zixibacteria bacterium]